jgi:DNA-binding MarR family transcriptional regulator
MRDRSKNVKGGSARRSHPVDAVPAAGTNVLFDVWLVARAVTGALDTALAPTGLTADEFGVYSVLSSSDVMTPTELARWMAAPPTTVSSYVKRLEGRGHVVRERNPDDGRSYVLRLAPTGRAAHRAGGQAFLPVLQRVVSALGRDEPAVRRALESLRVAIAEE